MYNIPSNREGRDVSIMTYIEISFFSVQEQKFPVHSMKESCFLLRNLLALSNYLQTINCSFAKHTFQIYSL